MNTDEIIKYYDDLMRLAVSKCGSSADAEDLVGDTMLAAFSYMRSGGVIQNTLSLCFGTPTQAKPTKTPKFRMSFYTMFRCLKNWGYS